MASAREILKTLEQEKAKRLQTIDQVKRDCYNYTYPIRGIGYGTNIGSRSEGSDLSQSNTRKANIYDATVTDCARTLAAFTISGIAPSNTRSFDFEVDGQEQKLPWLDEVSDITWKEVHASNFDSTGFDSILDLIIGGDCVLFCDFIDGGLHFEQWESATCYFKCSKKGGLVDTIYREYTLTKQQALKEFEGEDLPIEVTLADESKLLEFVHAIYPRVGGKPGALRKKLPFASCHIFKQTGKIIRESGYEEFPCAVPRWSVIPNSAYAVSPVYECLPTVKSLNLACKFVLQNAELAVCGMWGAVDDGVLNTGSIQIGPRKVVSMAEKDNLFPLVPGGSFQIAEAMIAQMQAEIRRLMMVDQIQIPYKPDTTATEINVRMDILRQILGPLFGRLQTEFLSVIITRAFGLLLRNGRLPPLPEELSSLPDITIRYINPLARAQRNIEVNAIMQFENSLSATAQVDPQVLDVYDFDLAAQEKANLMGVPAKLMRKNRDIVKMREARAQQQQAMQQQQMAA